MNQHPNLSQVARLRQQIDQEIEAMRQAVHGYATVSAHDIITHHYQNLGACFEELSTQIGEQAALETMLARLEGML
jgi:hypothetical protein